MNKEYEIALVLDPTLNQEEEKSLIEGVKGNIEKLKGRITDTDERGKQKLAYPIRKHREGIYYYHRIEIPPSDVNALEKLVRLNEKIIRHLVLGLEQRKIKARRLEKIFKKRKQIESNKPKPE